MNRAERFIYRKTFNAADRCELYDNFRHYLLDGISAEDTFNRLIDNYTRRGKKPGHPIAKILRECRDNLATGLTLAQSFREWLPDQERSIIEACDNAGKITDGFNNAMLVADGTARILAAVRGAAMNIAWLFCLVCGVVAMFCITLVPILLQSVPLAQWNGMQQAVYYLYLFMTHYYWLMAAGLTGAVYLVSHSLPRWTGNLRFYADRFPPYSIYKRLHGATFILNVNAMVAAGIPIEQILRKMYDSCQSAWLAEKLEATLLAIESGEQNLGSALDVTGYEFPGEEAIIKMQSLFETSNRAGSLKRFAEKWLEKSVQGVEKISSGMKNGGMLAAGGLVCFLMAVMYGLIQKAFFYN